MWTRCADGEDVLIAGIMEHIEEAGVHSGDSSCVLPPQSLPASRHCRSIEDYTVRLAKALNVIGLMNVQYAIQNGTVYVLEVNPRASRTVPYVSKATGVPLPKIAVGLMWGRKLARLHGCSRACCRCRSISSNRRYSRSTNSPAWTRRWGRRCAPRAK